LPRRVSLLFLFAVAALAFGPTAGATGTYRDATGDSNGAPDIISAIVSSTDTGQITIRINAGGLASGSDTGLAVFLDTDMNGATGDPDYRGAEFLLVVDESTRSYGFFRWDGSGYAVGSYATVTFGSDSGGVTFSINRSALDNTAMFNFWVRTSVGALTGGQVDDAPDTGAWNYSLSAGGPQITAAIVRTQPSSGPKAGRPFTISVTGVTVLPLDPSAPLPKPDGYTCRARLRGRSLSGSGKGGCSFRVPKRSRGQSLVLLVTVRYAGAAVTFRSVYRINGA